MPQKDRFTDDEWDALVLAPGDAFYLLQAADTPNPFTMLREAKALDKALVSDRKRDDWPPVVAELIAYQAEHLKELVRGRKDTEDLKEFVQMARQTLAVAGQAAAKLDPQEFDALLSWVLVPATKAAEAVKEKGSETNVTTAEAQTLAEIRELLSSSRTGAQPTDPPTDA